MVTNNPKNKKMKILKKYNYLLALITLGALVSLPVYAAPDDLVVDFESTPLFSETNFLPGNEVTRSVEVTNNTSESQDIVAEAINVVDPGDFAGALDLIISKGDTELFSGTLEEFFSAGEVSLSSIAGEGGSATYDFGVTFEPESGNGYQEDDLGFDIVIGFAGESEGDGGEGGGEGGGGGGGGGGGSPGVEPPPALTIVEETVETLNLTTTSVTIIWDTSYEATTRVVYGTTPDAFDFSSLPNYGYEFSSIETDTPASISGVTSHSVTITGLISGTTYYFRSISHGSPATLSFEHSFSTLNDTTNESTQSEVTNTEEENSENNKPVQETLGQEPDNQDSAQEVTGQIAGITQETRQTDNEEENEDEESKEYTNDLIASILQDPSSWFGGFLFWLILIILIVITLLIIKRKRDSKNQKTRF
jgi:hypothetical protein